MENVMKSIEVMQKKCAKYDTLMSRLVQLSAQLDQAAELLSSVSKELNPTGTGAGVRTWTKSNINYGELADDIYEKMQSGVEIDTAFIQRMYPDWTMANVVQLMHNIKKRPNVQSRQDGHKKFYYVLNDWKMPVTQSG